MPEPQRFDDADALARQIVARTDGAPRVALPLGLGKPNTIVNALTRLALDDRAIRLSILTALTLERPVPSGALERRFLAPAMDRLFGRYPPLHYAEHLHRGTLPPNIQVGEFFLMAGRWRGVERVQRRYISANYTHALRVLLAHRPNVLAQLLAPGPRGIDGAGRAAHDGAPARVSLACNTDISVDLLDARRRGDAHFLFVGELNGELPYMPGVAERDAGEVDLLLDQGDGFELFSSPKRPVAATDHAIGLHVSRMVPDGGTLQIGIGAVGDAVAHALLLRHRDQAGWRALIDAGPFRAGGDALRDARCEGAFDEGLYAVTEMLVDGLLQLYCAGVLRREVDGVAIHAGFFVESRAFYRRLRELPPGQLAKIAMMPVSFTNALYGAEADKRGARIGARFVNSAMMATLDGAIVSDGLADGQVVSGVGGQFDFVAQALELQGARAIVTLPAVRDRHGRAASNIVWSYPHQTVPRHCRDIVVTEYGVADLRGRTDEETIAAMLSIADSRFQEALRADAVRAGKLSPEHRIADAHRDNTPQALRRWLDGARLDGRLPAYPFGSDFDAHERRLLPALSLLALASGSKPRLLALAWRGLRMPAPTPVEAALLARMGLEVARGVRERLLRALLRGAIAGSAEEARRVAR
ncbi:MAG: acetyl-CoA hydrolase/transferase C-terminal domain-containing protein [Lautropia sp.]